jgi:hypothetical protein
MLGFLGGRLPRGGRGSWDRLWDRLWEGCRLGKSFAGVLLLAARPASHPGTLGAPAWFRWLVGVQCQSRGREFLLSPPTYGHL